MRKLTVKTKAELATIKLIEKFENKISTNLPRDYKFFLITQNPYNVKENLFIKDDRLFKIHGFEPLSEATFDYCVESYNDLYDIFEGRYYPFAYDEGGWLFIFSLQKATFGKVYFCRMDEDLDEALFFLSDSFEEFINGLKSSNEI